MKDLAILLDNCPGALANMGDALGRAGVGIEGGGAWVTGDYSDHEHQMILVVGDLQRAEEVAAVWGREA